MTNPNPQASAVTRRPLDFEDCLDAARRNRGWIAGSLFSALVASVIGAFLWPNTFASQAALRISRFGFGSLAGLLFGLAVAGTREARDTSLKNLKDVRAYANMPLLGSIPLLENDIIVRRRRRIEWLTWTMVFLTGAALMSAAILYYYFTQTGPNPAG